MDELTASLGAIISDAENERLFKEGKIDFITYHNRRIFSEGEDFKASDLLSDEDLKFEHPIMKNYR